MKYYIVYLWQGVVCAIDSFDNSEAQQKSLEKARSDLNHFAFQLNYDDVQSHSEVI